MTKDKGLPPEYAVAVAMLTELKIWHNEKGEREMQALLRHDVLFVNNV